MGWETRGGRGRYYTRSVRHGGRVVRQYLGAGGMGELIASFDAKERELRAAERAEQRELAAQREEAERLLLTFSQHVDAVVDATLTAAGYHRPKRGAWRKRRGRQE
jgi:hypothetical protein